MDRPVLLITYLVKKSLEEHVNWDQLFMFINEKSKTKGDDDYDPSCEEIDIP